MTPLAFHLIEAENGKWIEVGQAAAVRAGIHCKLERSETRRVFICYYTLLPAGHICPPDSHILLIYFSGISRWTVSHHHNHHLLLYAHPTYMTYITGFVSSTPFAIIHFSQAGVSTRWTYMSASYIPSVSDALNCHTGWFLDAIASPRSYPCQWLGQWVSQWLIVSGVMLLHLRALRAYFTCAPPKSSKYERLLG